MFKDDSDNDTSITISYSPTEIDVASRNEFGSIYMTDSAVTMQDTIRNPSEDTPLYITRVELKNEEQGLSIVGYEPETWSPGMVISEDSEVIVNIQFDPTELDANTTYIDSLGLGYGDKDFVECKFEYRTEQTFDTRISNVEMLAKSQYSSYPNPTKNRITISLEENVNISRYVIYDIDGNSILSGNGNYTSIQSFDIKSLSKGMYIIEVITNNQKFIRNKFIKQD